MGPLGFSHPSQVTTGPNTFIQVVPICPFRFPHVFHVPKGPHKSSKIPHVPCNSSNILTCPPGPQIYLSPRSSPQVIRFQHLPPGTQKSARFPSVSHTSPRSPHTRLRLFMHPTGFLWFNVSQLSTYSLRDPYGPEGPLSLPHVSQVPIYSLQIPNILLRSPQVFTSHISPHIPPGPHIYLRSQNSLQPAVSSYMSPRYLHTSSKFQMSLTCPYISSSLTYTPSRPQISSHILTIFSRPIMSLTSDPRLTDVCFNPTSYPRASHVPHKWPNPGFLMIPPTPPGREGGGSDLRPRQVVGGSWPVTLLTAAAPPLGDHHKLTR